jgi:hypothetical protein
MKTLTALSRLKLKPSSLNLKKNYYKVIFLYIESLSTERPVQLAKESLQSLISGTTIEWDRAFWLALLPLVRPHILLTKVTISTKARGGTLSSHVSSHAQMLCDASTTMQQDLSIKQKLSLMHRLKNQSKTTTVPFS